MRKAEFRTMAKLLEDGFQSQTSLPPAHQVRCVMAVCTKKPVDDTILFYEASGRGIIIIHGRETMRKASELVCSVLLGAFGAMAFDSRSIFVKQTKIA